ncbi:MAG: CAP domain-containing protein, partial [Bifidobacteriaceae bacterium]|nr:CAP domain-containing protein [Bifidobacteriaceae bacterium]
MPSRVWKTITYLLVAPAVALVPGTTAAASPSVSATGFADDAAVRIPPSVVATSPAVRSGLTAAPGGAGQTDNLIPGEPEPDPDGAWISETTVKLPQPDDPDGPDLGQTGKRSTPLAVPLNVNPINTNDKNAVDLAYGSILVSALNQQVAWNGSIAGCDIGAINPEAQAATITAINFYRRMAGLNPVTEDTAASSVARKTALMMIANGSLSHTPPTNWACWTNNGAHVANKSNLSLGNTGANAVRSQIDDFGDNNREHVGHRRWLLSPGQSEVGAGSVVGSNSNYTGANAIVVLSPTGSCSGTGCNGTSWNPSEGDAAFTITQTGTWASPQFVTWPSAGYFPYQMVANNPSTGQAMVWSVATGSSSIGFASASVQVSRNGANLGLATITGQEAVNGGGYGDRSAIMFQLPANALRQPSGDSTDVYTIRISNITGYVGVLEYNVHVFNASQVSLSFNISGWSWVGGSASVNSSTWVLDPSDAAVSYQWLRDGQPITGATAATYYFQPEDVGHRVVLEATATKAGFAPAVARSGGFTVAAGSFSNTTVSICSAPQTGQVCTATTSTSPAPDSTTYQWYVNDVPIVGATGSTYTPVTADLNKTLKVEATFVKAGYTTATGQATASQPVQPPTCAIGTVTISGTARTDQTLTAVVSGVTPSGASLAYQWLRDGVAISGATSDSYVVVAADVGKNIKIRVTATLSGYANGVKESAARTVTAASFTGTSFGACGSPQVGWACNAIASASPAAETYTWQWLVGGTVVPGATGDSYTPIPADYGKTLKAKVTMRRAGYNDTTRESGDLQIALGTINAATVTISGTFKTDQTLTGSLNVVTPTGTSPAYQWLRDGVDITGATAQTYTLTSADTGTSISLKVTVSHVGYANATKTSSQRWVYQADFSNSSLSFCSAPQVGVACAATASASPTPDAYAWQWLVGGTAVSGATGSSYTPTANDAGKTLRPRVTIQRAGYYDASPTASSIIVTPGNSAISTVTISGTARTDQTLTAVVSGVTPSDATRAYQWMRDGAT